MEAVASSKQQHSMLPDFAKGNRRVAHNPAAAGSSGLNPWIQSQSPTRVRRVGLRRVTLRPRVYGRWKAEMRVSEDLTYVEGLHDGGGDQVSVGDHISVDG
jgi:hypothetical protein